MNLLQFLFILRAHYKVALLVAILTVVVVMVGRELAPRQYTAETAVMVDIKSPDPVAAVLLPAMMVPGNIGTQADIINSDRVARKVVKMLRLDESPALKDRWLAATQGTANLRKLDNWIGWLDSTQGKGKLEDWIANLLQRGLKVTPSRDSNVIRIAFAGGDPVFVAAVANAYAQAYIEASIELKVEPARQYARWFGEQAKVLRESLEKAQARLSEYQQEKGIVATEESMDYEVQKLSELAARLTAVQGETRDAQSKQRSAGGMDTLPEVQQSGIVQGLRTDIAQREAKLKETAGNLGIKHPQYLRMESELAELKNRLVAETSHVASGYSASSAVGKTKEAELKAAIEAQKKRLLDLRKERDEISVLVREVDTAKRAYEAVTNRFNQTSLESQATQTNVSVLTPALEPLEPSFPKPLGQTLLMAIALGILLGGASAFGLEMLDRRVRSASDLAEMMQLPVLGVIVRPRRRSRLVFWRRSTALVAR